ncbi:hypothetical protein FHG87_006421 [Trinorchestia longiramus]|nr:hypothetical protein FHG87_006421 [Trinorchestia longiramus]
MLTRAAGGTVQASSLDECRAAAASKGAHAFWYTQGVCEVASLLYPLCLTRGKNFELNVLQDYLSSGDPSDDAYMTSDVVSNVLGTTSHTSFRITAPTITKDRKLFRNLRDFESADAAHADNFILLRDNGRPVAVHRDVLADPTCYTNSTCGVPFFTSYVRDDGPNTRTLILHFESADAAHADNFILLRDNGRPVAVHRDVLADPACYTNSTCGVPFFTSYVRDDGPNTRTLILHDVCSKRFPMRRGQVYYLLSHAGIGCKPFPTTYPEPGCSVLFRGFERFGHLKAKVTLVDFKGTDRCEGQYLKLTTFEGFGNPQRNKFNVCRKPVNEVTTREGRIRITLGGSETITRQKYGFIIKISY